MNTIFHEYLRKIIECHIDDITVKSHDKDKGDHKADLKRVFDIMRVHQLRWIQPSPSWGVASCKFLEFIVISKGIHLDPEKVHAIQEMWLVNNIAHLLSYSHAYYRINSAFS